ncbi:MAG: hypothetical protein KDI71_12205 [Xanthomonadales bacterium]|nr:hypothetical protein [Xanthomonadales bacterium]
MYRYGRSIWRHGLSRDGQRQRSPSPARTLLLTLPWLLLSAMASDIDGPSAPALESAPQAAVAADLEQVGEIGTQLTATCHRPHPDQRLTVIRIRQ